MLPPSEKQIICAFAIPFREKSLPLNHAGSLSLGDSFLLSVVSIIIINSYYSRISARASSYLSMFCICSPFSSGLTGFHPLYCTTHTSFIISCQRGYGKETVEHYLLECQNYRDQRKKLRVEGGKGKMWMEMLLRDLKTIKHTLTGIHQGNRQIMYNMVNS
jgi:hypothetical protein